MSRRHLILRQRLDQIEDEFQSLLIPCLQMCSRGRYGLFVQEEHLDPEWKKWLHWSEAQHLRELAQEINHIRTEFGTVNLVNEQFLRLCSLRGSNVPGEPRLAAEFLEWIAQKSAGAPGNEATEA